MADFNTTTNSSLLTTYLQKDIIKTLEEELQCQKFCVKGDMPKQSGKTVRWNVFGNPGSSTTALNPEGAQPYDSPTTINETSISTTGTDATLAEYGEYIPFTKLSEITSAPGTREEIRKRFSFGGMKAVDTLIRNEALTTTTAFYAGAGQTGGSTTVAAPADGSAAAIMGASKELWDNAAIGFTGVPGHPGGELAAVVAPQTELDMVTEASTTRMTWKDAVVNVPGAMGQEKAIRGKMGSVYGTACYRSQNLSTTTVSSNLSYNNIIFSEGGIGCVAIDDMDPQVYVNEPGEGSTDNPYRNRSTISWHIFFATALIDSNRIVRLYTDA